MLWREWRRAYGQPAARTCQGALPVIRRPADGGKRFPTHPADLRRRRAAAPLSPPPRRVRLRQPADLLPGGEPSAVVAPDVFVLGAANEDRSSYRLWQEPKGPDFVLEITSRTTYREDQGKKREVYRTLDVREYWQYDPTGDYLEPPLQGLELSAGEYRRLPGRELADGTLALASAVLGLELRLTWAALLRSADRAGAAEPCRNRRGAASGGSTGGRAGSPVAPGARQRIRPGRQSSGTSVEGTRVQCAAGTRAVHVAVDRVAGGRTRRSPLAASPFRLCSASWTRHRASIDPEKT